MRRGTIRGPRVGHVALAYSLILGAVGANGSAWGPWGQSGVAHATRNARAVVASAAAPVRHKAVLRLRLSMIPSPLPALQTGHITATVSRLVADGRITFTLNGSGSSTTLYTCAPTRGACSMAWARQGIGVVTITARWSGDSRYLPTRAARAVVVQRPTATSSLVWQGARVDPLTRVVPSVAVDRLRDARVAGRSSRFTTTERVYACVHGQALRVFTASRTFPGDYVAYSPARGAACPAGAWLIAQAGVVTVARPVAVAAGARFSVPGSFPFPQPPGTTVRFLGNGRVQASGSVVSWSSHSLTLRAPRQLARGTYTVALGWYDRLTGATVRTAGGPWRVRVDNPVSTRTSAATRAASKFPALSTATASPSTSLTQPSSVTRTVVAATQSSTSTPPPASATPSPSLTPTQAPSPTPTALGSPTQSATSSTTPPSTSTPTQIVIPTSTVAATVGSPTSTPTPPATATPLPPATSTPTTTNTATSTPTVSDPVVMAAGDIACDPTDGRYNGGKGTGTSCMQGATANQLANISAVINLGDNQYNNATLRNFNTVYDPTWGRQKAITYPSAGNHEYLTSGASGYYTYFGSAASPQDAGCTANCKGYYSYNLGAWHVIVLNSNCSNVGGCAAGSPQEAWLRSDLGANAGKCTLAYWHHPRFTSSDVGNDSDVAVFWQDLYNAHADLVLNGHAHNYERFAPQDPAGTANPTNGITEIIVGTGGEDHASISSTIGNSAVHNTNTFGVLKLALHATSFSWQFIPETQSGNGTFTDSGSQACHL